MLFRTLFPQLVGLSSQPSPAVAFKVISPPLDIRHPVTEGYSCFTRPTFSPNSGQLCRAIPASELAMASAKALLWLHPSCFSPCSALLLLQVWIQECSPAHFLHRFSVYQYVSKEPDLHQQSLERLRMFVPMRISGLLLQSPGLRTSLYGKELPLHTLMWALFLPISISLLLHSSSWNHVPNQLLKSSSRGPSCILNF